MEEQMDKPMRDLIEIIHFTENVSTKIHGILDDDEIYRTVKGEFEKSKRYDVCIFLVTDDGSNVRVAEASIPFGKVKAVEKATGLGRMKEYKIDLNKSSILSQVVREGKTVQGNVSDIMGEVFPRPLAHLIARIIGYKNRPVILTPLYRHGNAIGVFSVSSTELSEHFIPSAKNLAQHISTALELADEHAEHKKAEEELALERDLLHALMDNIPDSIYFKDVASCFTRINRAQAQILGVNDPRDAIGKTDFDFFTPEHARDAYADEQKIVKSRQPLISKVEKIRRADGQSRWVSATKVPIMDEEGQVTGIVGISRDITERKIMEERVAYLASIVDNAKVAIATVDMNGIVTYCNKVTEEMLGWASKEFMGKPMARFCPNAGKQIEVTMKEGFCLDKELEYVKKDGGSLLCSTSTFLMRDEDGNPIGVGGIAIDITERKKMEEALRLLSSAVEQSSEGMAVSDLEGNLLFVNNAFAAMHGYVPEELVGKHLSIFHTPEQTPAVEAANRQMQETGEFSGEIWHVRRDGTVFPTLMHNSLLRDEAGNSIGMIGTLRDITERKKAEEALKESEELYRTLIQASPDVIIMGDLTGKIMHVNPQAVKMNRFKNEEEIIGLNPFDYIIPEDRERAMNNLIKTLETGIMRNTEYTLIRKDGTLYHAELNNALIRDAEGKPKALLSIIRDITDRKKAEEMVRESEERHRELSESITDTFFAMDRNLKYTYWNKASEKLTSIKAEDAIGKSIFEIFPDREDTRKAIAVYRRVIQTKQPKTFVNKYQLGGKVYFFEISAYPTKDGISVFVKDITERKQMEEELRRYSEHLENLVEERTRKLREAERLAAIGETAAMVGHDLRNPLQVLINTVYLGKEVVKSMPSPCRELTEKEGLEELFRTVGEQVEYMNKIVSDLQDYARPLKPELVETSLHQLINDTLSTIAVPETIKVSMEIEGDLDFPKLMVDPTMMKRVFTNLFTNALQAMPDGGQLIIRASRTEEVAFISVQDTGIGIPEENLPKLFHPLFTTKPKGTGFGLPVCKRLVEAHGGSITVESKVGRGSAFTVKIPLKKEVK